MTFLAILLFAQITKPPEFEDAGKFATSPAAGTVDGSSHVAAERAVVNQELLAILRRLPGYAEGVHLIEGQMPGAAQAHFEAKRQRVGVAVTLFLAGKAEESAELLCKLAKEKEHSALPVIGETIGVAPAWSQRLLAAIQSLSRPPSSVSEYYLGRALLKQEPPHVVEARRHLARSARLDVKATAALLELARQAPQPEEAIQWLEEALRRNGRLGVAHYRLAQLYRADGQMEKSRQHLREFEASRGK
ncbi:MAG: hypothetical protein K2X03_20425 [Bryobacteraceae bacterium]|nr:hypothetical protein [Bryobacteraceae bacterium]